MGVVLERVSKYLKWVEVHFTFRMITYMYAKVCLGGRQVGGIWKNEILKDHRSETVGRSRITDHRRDDPPDRFFADSRTL